MSAKKAGGKAKEPVSIINLIVPAGSANPSPPIGPALGQHGLNIMDFCKDFNDKTKDFDKGAPIPVTIHGYKDRSFDIYTKAPTVKYMIMKAAGIKKGSGTPNTKKVGKITVDQCRKVAQEKMVDMNTTDVEAATRTVIGSAKAMGLEIVGA